MDRDPGPGVPGADPSPSAASPSQEVGGRAKKDAAAAGKWKGSGEAGRLAEAVLILSRCQRFLR